MSRTLFIFLSLLALSSLTACQTWNGFGKDLTSAGQAITGDKHDDSSGY
ncbi:MAG: entericidin EcnA/B family protein [Rickettsiales bacterium]|nr:entericidin EcnA/B family protein [Rickettsiales bacterium]